MKIPAIADLLPHKSTALLLDEILAVEPGAVRCGLTVRAVLPNYEAREEIETSIGIEYLAQAAGVRIGLNRIAGTRGQTGMLLAVRNLECCAPYYLSGQRLIAEARLNSEQDDESLAICAGSLYDAESGQMLMRAVLTIYSGDDISGRVAGE